MLDLLIAASTIHSILFQCYLLLLGPVIHIHHSRYTLLYLSIDGKPKAFLECHKYEMVMVIMLCHILLLCQKWLYNIWWYGQHIYFYSIYFIWMHFLRTIYFAGSKHFIYHWWIMLMYDHIHSQLKWTFCANQLINTNTRRLNHSPIYILFPRICSMCGIWFSATV
jgi:hypothetical protein